MAMVCESHVTLQVDLGLNPTTNQNEKGMPYLILTSETENFSHKWAGGLYCQFLVDEIPLVLNLG